MGKSVVIIGAGIAGLSAGCYGQMNGYKTQIFEMHDKPGGVCTSWTRKGYTIDGCLHWVVGSSPKSGYHRLWEELGAIQNRKFVDFEEYRRIEDETGKAWTIHSDLDRLEQHMKDVAPEDSKAIHEFVGGARSMARLNWSMGKAPELYNPLDYLKMMPSTWSFLPTLLKFRKIRTAEYAQRFKNPSCIELSRQASLANLVISPCLPGKEHWHSSTRGKPGVPWAARWNLPAPSRDGMSRWVVNSTTARRLPRYWLKMTARSASALLTEQNTAAIL